MVIAAHYCNGDTRLTHYAAAYLKGDYQFFGMPSEPHHRMLLESAGVDVGRMLQAYRDRG